MKTFLVMVIVCLATVSALPTTTTNATTSSPDETESVTVDAAQPTAKQVNFMVVVPEESRILEEDIEDYADEVEDGEDMEVSETIVFRPLYRYKNKGRRGYRPQPQRRNDVRYRQCPPCRPYFFF